MGWTGHAIPGSFGVGGLVLASGSPANPGVLEAPFTLGTPVVGPFCPSGIGVLGGYSAIAADLLGNAYISYYDATAEDLKLSSGSHGSWSTEIVDGTGSRGTSTSIALLDGVVSISYRDATPGSETLRFATGTPGNWTTEDVETNGDPGLGSSLVLNTFGQPRIAYFAAGASEVSFAVKSGGAGRSRRWTPAAPA